jgi:lysine 2,3-aminomutase
MPRESSKPAVAASVAPAGSAVPGAGHPDLPLLRTLRTGRELVAAGLIAADAAETADGVGATYSIAVPPVFAALIDPGDPNDPIARQVLPDPRERILWPGERSDPIGDAAHSPVKGVTHRYLDRVLLKPVLACPLYCRFCFRREVVGRAGGSLTPGELDAALAYIERQPAVREVILTGGDPLLLAPRRLQALLARLARVDHVETLRIHSRVPVAVPERVDAALVAALRPGLAVWLSVHVNHPRELGESAAAALTRLADAGVPLLAQTVLLRGVNDDPEVLATLFRQMVRLRVKPYYLHHPDLAPGTAHFRLDLAEGQRIFQALRGRLSGHALPTYVLDIPGGAGKIPVETPWVRTLADGGHEIRDPKGGTHRYP